MGKVKQALEEDMILNPEKYNNPDPTKEEYKEKGFDDFIKKHIIIGSIPDRKEK